jgi:hypothetical protein
MLIVEGYDCTGKSTLVEKVQRWTAFATVHSGGPPRDLNHVRRCLARCASRMTRPCIQDRVTQVSESVYGMLCRPSMAALALSRIGDLRMARLLIYCRPGIETILAKLTVHTAKGEYDTPEHVQHVLSNAQAMIAIYDTVIDLARQHVDVFVYDYERPNIDERQLQSLIEGIEP